MSNTEFANYKSLKTMVVHARKIRKNSKVMIISGKHQGKNLKVVAIDNKGKLMLQSLVGLNSHRKVYNIKIDHSNVKLAS